MHGLPSSAPKTKCGHSDAGRADGRTDIRSDANTPNPYFVERGIRTTRPYNVMIAKGNHLFIYAIIIHVLLVQASFCMCANFTHTLRVFHSKQQTLRQCCFIAGPASEMVNVISASERRSMSQTPRHIGLCDGLHWRAGKKHFSCLKTEYQSGGRLPRCGVTFTRRNHRNLCVGVNSWKCSYPWTGEPRGTLPKCVCDLSGTISPVRINTRIPANTRR